MMGMPMGMPMYGQPYAAYQQPQFQSGPQMPAADYPSSTPQPSAPVPLPGMGSPYGYGRPSVSASAAPPPADYPESDANPYPVASPGLPRGCPKRAYIHGSTVSQNIRAAAQASTRRNY